MLKLKALIATADMAGLNPRKHARAIKLARDITATRALADFQGITRSWRNKPDFKIVDSGDETTVGTDDKIFGYVDEGTKPHIIRPKKKRLRFMAGFTPKTSPGSLTSGKGGRSGPVVYARVVHHPGSAARGYSKLIAERAQALIVETTAQQLAIAVKG